MSGWPLQLVWSFLEKVGAIAPAPADIPDFGELFAEDEVPGEVKRVTPDAIDEAVDLGLEKTEIAKKQAAEESRVAAQQDVIAGLRPRNDSVPAQPEPVKLTILDTAEANKVSDSIETADKAFQTLSNAQGEADEAFKTASDQAKSALDARDAAIKTLNESLATELARRKDAITALQGKFDAEKTKMGPDVPKLLEAGGKQRSIGTLKTALPTLETAIGTLTQSAATATPAEFTVQMTDATNLVGALTQQIANVNALVANMGTQKRKAAVADLKPSLPVIPAANLAVLPPGDMAKRLNDTAVNHKKSHDILAALPPTAGQDVFDKAERETTIARDAAALVHTEATQAILAERGRRDREAQALDRRNESIATPDSIYGTTEATAFSKARLKVRSAIEAVKNLASAGTPAAFDDATKAAATALDELGVAKVDATEQAGKRAEELKTLQAALMAQATPLSAKMKSMSSSPVAAAVTAAQGAVGKAFKAARDAVNGKDLAADALTVKTFTALAKEADALLTMLGKLAAASFAPVSDNETIKADVAALVAQLGNVGVGSAATALAETLVKDVNKITDDYLGIDQLVSRYDDIIADANATQQQKASIRDVPDFKRGRAGYAKGKIAERIEQLLKLVRPIEADLEAKKETAEYLASAAYAFIQLMENNDATVIEELEALVTASTAAQGPINSAYRSSYDNPDRFSVEVATPIDGRSGVVVHAHCQTDGNPQPAAGACHVKLYKYRFDPGGVVLSATLRGSLIPAAASNLAKARAAQLVA